jgi:uncharacterized protein YbcI
LENSTDTGREISRGMVALLKRYVGRGPTHARAYLEDDLVVILLRDTMTRAERTLVAEEEADVVRSMRRIFQGKFRDDAIELVEERTGRNVIAFLSDHAVDPDYAVEVFVLDSESAAASEGERD